MTTQDVNLHIQNGGLALTLPSAQQTGVVMGCCSSGPTNIVSLESDVNVLRTTYGYGPMVEAAANLINQNGATVIVCRVPTTTDGACSAVTHTGTGASTCTVAATSSGSILDEFQVLLTITKGGTIGTDSIQLTYSRDFGGTTSAVITLGTAVTYAVPGTGVTASFTTATVVAGDTYFFRTSAPLWAVADVSGSGKALDILDGSGLAWGGIHLVGTCGESDAVSIEAKMVSLQSAHDYSFILTEADDYTFASSETEAAWIARLEAAFAAFVTAGSLEVCAGNYTVVSPYSSDLLRRNLAWPLFVRAMSKSCGVDMARVSDGPLSNCSLAPRSSVDTDFVHDERKTPGLDAAGFSSLRTIKGRQGPYMLNAKQMVASGSDYTLLQYRRVIDEACNITRDYLLNYLSGNVRLTPSTGFILDKDAIVVEAGCAEKLKEGLINTGDASAASVAISRTDVLTGTGAQMHVLVEVQPLGYLKDIEVNMTLAVTV